jgi:uncharacterized membrane protein
MPNLDSMFDWFWPFMVASLLLPLIITVLVIVMVVWIVRRNSVPHEDPAVTELKERFARGEIDTAAFEVRMRSLTGDRD